MFHGPCAPQSPATRQSGGTWALIFFCLGFGGSGQIATCTQQPFELLLPLFLFSLPILPRRVKSGYRKRESIDAPAAAFLFPSLVERGLGASCWLGKTAAPRADCPIGHTQLQPSSAVAPILTPVSPVAVAVVHPWPTCRAAYQAPPITSVGYPGGPSGL